MAKGEPVSIPRGRKSLSDHTKTLRVGDGAPDFRLPSHRGSETVRLDDFRGKKHVVLAFYPLDWTGV
jgi:peroxiredoxin